MRTRVLSEWGNFGPSQFEHQSIRKESWLTHRLYQWSKIHGRGRCISVLLAAKLKKLAFFGSIIFAKGFIITSLNQSNVLKVINKLINCKINYCVDFGESKGRYRYLKVIKHYSSLSNRKGIWNKKNTELDKHLVCPVGWGCSIEETASLQRGKTLPTSILDMKINNDGEVPIMLEFWKMLSTPLLPLLPGPL